MTARLPLHPAKFSDPILDKLAALVTAEARRIRGRVTDRPVTVLDPFAGVGRIHRLARPGRVRTWGLEIEPEWAACHQDTVCTDAIDWLTGHPYLRMMGDGVWTDGAPNGFDIVATSPCYGNRLSDHHEARDGSTRRSYRHDLGRPLTENSSGALPWGPAYWTFHAEAYRRIRAALRPGGLFLLNVSDFYRRKALVSAVEWHRGTAMGAGFLHGGRDVPILTRRLQGVGTEDTAARADHEVILRLRRPEVD